MDSNRRIVDAGSRAFACCAKRPRWAIVNLTGALKRWMRQDLQADWEWQEERFDRLLRSSESAQEKWSYIRENPVRANLVKHWKNWPYKIGFDE